MGIWEFGCIWYPDTGSSAYSSLRQSATRRPAGTVMRIESRALTKVTVTGISGHN